MMYKFLFLIIVGLQLSCFQSSETSIANISNEKSNNIAEHQPISADKAILIAQNYLSPNRTMKDFQPSVETENHLFKEYGEMWKVTFNSKNNNQNDKSDQPVVWIYKADGKVFTREQVK